MCFKGRMCKPMANMCRHAMCAYVVCMSQRCVVGGRPQGNPSLNLRVAESAGDILQQSIGATTRRHARRMLASAEEAQAADEESITSWMASTNSQLEKIASNVGVVSRSAADESVRKR